MIGSGSLVVAVATGLGRAATDVSLIYVPFMAGDPVGGAGVVVAENLIRAGVRHKVWWPRLPDFVAVTQRGSGHG
jgi:hypothetical protein